MTKSENRAAAKAYQGDGAAMGMIWWNALDDKQRKHWMEIAGNTGRAVDAWRAFRGSSENPLEISD